MYLFGHFKPKGEFLALKIDFCSILQNDDGYITSKELQEVLNQMGVAVTGKWNVPICFVCFFPAKPVGEQVPFVQMFCSKKRAWLFHLIGDKAPPTV